MIDIATHQRAALRAADADRKSVIAELQRHYVDGRLRAEELDERIAIALEARTFGDLDALLADLPSLPRQPGSAAATQSRAHDKGFGAHATSYVLVMALLVGIWLLTTPGSYFWPIWPMLGWGIGLASHSLATGGRGAWCARTPAWSRER